MRPVVAVVLEWMLLRVAGPVLDLAEPLVRTLKQLTEVEWEDWRA